MSIKDKYWIAFSSINQLGSDFILKLYSHFKDIEKAWNCTDLSFYEGLTIKKAESFFRLRDSVNIDDKVNMISDRKLSYITFESEKYPY